MEWFWRYSSWSCWACCWVWPCLQQTCKASLRSVSSTYSSSGRGRVWEPYSARTWPLTNRRTSSRRLFMRWPSASSSFFLSPPAYKYNQLRSTTWLPQLTSTWNLQKELMQITLTTSFASTHQTSKTLATWARNSKAIKEVVLVYTSQIGRILCATVSTYMRCSPPTCSTTALTFRTTKVTHRCHILSNSTRHVVRKQSALPSKMLMTWSTILITTHRRSSCRTTTSIV